MSEESVTCKICSTPPLRRAVFVNHIMGKRHKKKATARFHTNIFVNKRSIQIDADLVEKFAEPLLFKYLDFNVVDAHFLKKRCFIEFKTEEDAQKALKAKFNIKGLRFQASIVKEEGRPKPKGAGGIKRKMPLLSPELMRNLATTSHQLDPDNLIRQLVKEIELQPKDIHIREHIRSALETFLEPLFPGNSTFIFGSSANNLGFTGCDVDMVTDLKYDCWKKGAPKGEAEREANKLTRYLATELRKRGLGRNVVAIGKARVPIVKFTEAIYGLEVDLSFKSGMPIFNTDLIKCYTTAHSIVRPFMMFIRYWAKVQGISGGGHPSVLLTNYCLCMMVLVWLMMRKDPIVPPVSALQRDFPPMMVDGCNCGFRKNFNSWKKKSHSSTIIDLAVEFFEFYGQMDYKEWVISPLTGALMPRNDVKNGQPSSREPLLARFYEEKSRLQLNTPLCVQDPFDTNHNIARGYSIEALNIFQLKCLKAMSICRDIREGAVSIGDLFDEYDLDDVKSKNPAFAGNVCDVSLVDEIMSLASSDSVELLQELESGEKVQEEAKELLEAINSNREFDDKQTECGSQDSSDAVILCEESSDSQTSDNPALSRVALAGSSKDEDITIVDVVSKEEKLVALVSLDDSIDHHSDCTIVDNRLGDDAVIDSGVSVNGSEQIVETNSVEELTISGASSEESCDRGSSSFLTDVDHDFHKPPLLNPTKELYKFSFDFYSRSRFTIDANGRFRPIKDSLLSPDAKDKFISDLLTFIVKRVFLCDILDEEPSRAEQDGELVGKDEKKRKNSESYSSNKVLKVSNDEVVCVKADFPLVSLRKCRTRYKFWEGRKKMQKEVPNYTALNPLQMEMLLVEKFERLDMTKEYKLDFEMRLWKDATTPRTLFWVTVHKGQSETAVSNVDKIFQHFFLYFSKYAKSILHRIDGYNFKS